MSRPVRAVQALLFILALVSSFADAQVSSSVPVSLIDISGVVRDSVTRLPVEGVLVAIAELKRVTYTDAEGVFRFVHVPSKHAILVFRLVGYHDQEVGVQPVQSNDLNVQLAPEEILLPSVTIKGERAPTTVMEKDHAVAYLNSQEIEKLRGQTLGKTLENVAGVTLLQTGPSIAKPVIRGLHSQRILILNAGVPLEGQQWGGEHAPEIDPFAPAEIVVLKGAAGVEYGAGAIGGVIRLEPKAMPDHAGLDGDLMLNAFANNRQGAGSLSLQGMSELVPGVSFRAQGSFRRAGISSAPDYSIGNSGFHEENGSMAVGYKTDQSELRALFSHYQTELGIYKGSHIGSVTDLQRAIANGRPTVDYPFTYDIIPPKQNISHDTWSVAGSSNIRDLGKLEIQYGWQSNHRQEFDAFRFFNNVQQLPTQAAFDLTLTTHSADVRLRHLPIGGLYGSLGVSALRQGNVGAGSSFLIPNYRLYAGGLFWVEALNLDRLTLNGGIRYDYRWLHVYPFEAKRITEETLQYNNVSGAVGFTFEFGTGWSLGGNAGSAFRPPSVNELFSDGVHHGSAEYEKGDPNLQTERSYSVDMTLAYRDDENELSVSTFSNMMDHFIFLLPDPVPVLTLRGAFPYFQYKQANSILRGMEASVGWMVASQLRLGMTISLVRGDNLETNEPLYQMPADRIRTSLKHEFANADLYDNAYVEIASLFVARQDRFPRGVDYVDPPGGYSLWEIATGADVNVFQQRVGFHLHVSNLFNKAYRDYLSRFRYFIDEPGRDIELKLQIPFFLYHS
ncbi:MAG: TonB-dependent receptor [Bacteroidota bacterium]